MKETYRFAVGHLVRRATQYETVPANEYHHEHRAPKRRADGHAVTRPERLTRETFVIVTFDEEEIRDLALTALRSKGGRAKSGPIVAKRIGALHIEEGPEE